MPPSQTGVALPPDATEPPATATVAPAGPARPDAVPPAPQLADHRPAAASEQWALLVVGVVFLVLAATLSIEDRRTVVVPGLGLPLPELCTLRRTAGIDCPGCGLTRSCISLGHGRWLEAWSYHPAGFVAFLLIAGQVPYRVLQLVRIRRGQRPWDLSRWGVRILAVAAVVLIVRWIVLIATRGGM